MALLSSGCRATVDGLTNVQGSSTTQQWQATSLDDNNLHVPCRQSSKHFISGQLKVIPLFRYSVIPYSAFYSIPKTWAYLHNMYTPLISRTTCKLTLHCSLLQPPLLSYKLAFLFHLSIFHFCSILHFLFDHLSNLNFAPSFVCGRSCHVHVWCGVRVRASCVNLDCFRFSDRRTVKNSRTSTRYVSNYVSYSLYRPAWTDGDLHVCHVMGYSIW